MSIGYYKSWKMIKMLREADRSALNTFIGTALIKMATGVIGLWGSINIYFFSYLRSNGTEITKLTNSVIMLCAMVPASFAVFLSARLGTLLGYKTVVRICACIFAFSPYLINLSLNLFTMGLFYLLVPITCFAISSIPVLNCLWSQFPNDLNKVSGSAVLFFSLGMIIWNLIFVGITNPDNIKAEIVNEEAFFPPEISGNVFKASNVMFAFSGISFLIGSFLIEKRQDNNRNQLKLEEESPPPQPFQTVGSQAKKSERTSEENLEERKAVFVGKRLVRDVIRDRKFVILFLISFLVPLYIIFMTLYMKLIFMPIINDDHFLAMCSVILTVSAVFGAPFWGYLGDKKGFKFTLLLVLAFDLTTKILGLFCQEKWNLTILFFALGFNDKGILTIIGPGLIEIFGLEMATELIPYKGLSLFFAYVVVPIIQITLIKSVPYQAILLVFVGCSVTALALGRHFYYRVSYQPFREEPNYEKQREYEEKNVQLPLP